MKRLLTHFTGLAMLVLTLIAFSPKANAAAYCINDVWGYTYNLDVTPAGGGIYNISGTCNILEWADLGIISGTYNRGANALVLTVTNPSPDGCVIVSGSFTLTGSRSGGILNNSWTNDCGGFGTQQGMLSAGTCGLRIAPTKASPNSPGSAVREALIITQSISPNPASTSVAVNYTITEAQQVNISVMDLSGRVIAVLEDGIKDAGSYTANWDMLSANTSLPSGLYLVRINDEVEKLQVY